MKTLRTYENFNYNFKKEDQRNRYQKILDEIMNAKIGDILPNSTIYMYIEYLTEIAGIHRYEECFVDGDLGNRIDQFDEYKLMEVDINDIDDEEWSSDDIVVDDYKKIYKKYNEYPPIVLDSDMYNKHNSPYCIIDGTHRTRALRKAGFKKVLAFVGV